MPIKKNFRVNKASIKSNVLYVTTFLIDLDIYGQFLINKYILKLCKRMNKNIPYLYATTAG